MTTQNDERIWERLPAGEPPRAYYYAEKYFEMGPTRSIARVSKIVEISQRQLKRWSALGSSALRPMTTGGSKRT
jgi:hypothetical protein